MKKETIVYIIAALLMLASVNAHSLDYPHNDANIIACDSCHYVYGYEPTLLPEWTNHVPQDIDDTQYNILCVSACHNGSDAPFMETHSSLVIDNGYGDWAVECRTCHNPHKQQFRVYGSAAYLETGTVSAVDSSTLTKNGAADWTENEYQGLIVVPNTAKDKYNYKILSNTNDTLTVKGSIDLTQVNINDAFGISYGKLIYDKVRRDRITDPVPPRSGEKEVRFYRSTGTNSFADGNSVFNGICEVCHESANHFRSDGTVNHDSQSGMDHSTVTGTDCITCHPHSSGFAHGGGSGGTGCVECHGHDAGTLYDPDMSFPYAAGTQASQGRGTVRSHSTHTESHIAGSSGDDDRKGPGIYCSTCHDTSSFPNFIYSAILDANTDGKVDLSETDVCDACHSDGGTYDGVNDADLGAKYGNSGELKYNWKNGIYAGNGKLKTGNEKWCATCHDDSPSQILSVDAPNVIGDEGAATNYSVGYGFYKTGHGLPANQYYPASGGTTPGAGISCDYCHDLSMKHIDGVARTYVYTAAPGDDNDYQHGYRLTSINGLAPMDIPRSDACETDVKGADFRLCFSCHDSTPFTSASNYDTNFRHTGPPEYNAHFNHLAIPYCNGYGPVFASDWKAHGYDSRASCVTCHNVHGSPQLSMVRDGSLVGKQSFEVLYYKPGVSFDCFNYPDIRDVAVHESTGTIYSKNTGGLCSACHGSCGLEDLYLRVPFDNTPPRITKAQGLVGSDSLTVSFSESVYSDVSQIGDLLTGDFTFTDADNNRLIDGVAHVAGDSSATVSLDSVLDDTNDIGTDTLAAASAASIYDGNDLPMDTTSVTISELGPATQATIHPSGLDSATDCSPTGGVWADILDTHDGDASYADCYSYYDEMMSELYPADIKVSMDDPSGLAGAVINQITARAVVNLTAVSGGGGPPGSIAYLQICYETGGAGQECSVQFDLDGTEGYIEIFIGNTVDPEGNPLDLNDVNNLKIQVTLSADDCCGAADGTAHVTEVYAVIDYTIPTDDSDPPVLSNQDPANGTSGIDTFSNLTFTVSDSGSEVDWNTLEVELSGDKGYSQLFTDSDFQVISKTGFPARYDVTVNPDVDFGEVEIITVTVRAKDFYGNSLAHPAWSFTTASAPVPQTLILHPSGDASPGVFSVTGGTWADVLDTNDGDTSYAYYCCDAPGESFYVDMDDPAGLGGAVIQSITFHVYARYMAGPGGGTAAADVDIGFKTGAITEWRGNYTTDLTSNYHQISSITYTTDSDGGTLDLTDINNIQIAVQRNGSGSQQLHVTEVYVEVTYLPGGADGDLPTISSLNPINGGTGVPVDSNLTFTLADSGWGVDWSTFSIQLTGDSGYPLTNYNSASSQVTKTGNLSSYDVTVNPDTDFGNSEVITVTVTVDDFAGNSLVPPAWSFTADAGAAPQVMTLHPSGNVSTGGFSVFGGTWADVLDTNDGDTSYAYYCCDAPGQIFYVDMDDPVGLGGVTIQSIKFHAYARYKASPGGGTYNGNVNIGFRTGTATVWRGDYQTDLTTNYHLISSITYTADSDGGALDLTDLNNIQIAVQRNASGSPQLQVTEIYVEVTYVP